MVQSFSAPVLNLAVDVLKEIDGVDACTALCTLLSKCKESVKDGHRYENLFLRLWHRERLTKWCTPTSPETLPHFSVHAIDASSSASSNTLLDDSEHLIPSSLLVRSPLSMSTSTLSASPTPSTYVKRQSIGQTISDLIISNPAESASRIHTLADSVSMVQTSASPSTIQPALTLPVSPVSSSSDPSNPRVVVLKPTPLPSPHATPQRTPHPTPPPSPIVNASIPFGYLLPRGANNLASLSSSSSLKGELSTAPSSSSPLELPSSSSALAPLARRDERSGSYVNDAMAANISPASVSPDGGDATTSSGGRSPNTLDPSPDSDHLTIGRRRGKEPVRSRKRTNPAQLRMQARRRSSSHEASHSQTHSSPAQTAQAFKSGLRPAEQAKSKASPLQPPPKTIVDVSDDDDDSAFETTESEGDDDDSWISDDGFEEDRIREQAQREARRLREAAEEAQRQKDLFKKKPSASYTNLGNRTRSGLLSALLNPDPNIFPSNHPYRTSRSTSDFQSQYPTPESMGNLRRNSAPRQMLQMTKSMAALPQADKEEAKASPSMGTYMRMSRQKSEADDDSSDPENVIQVSRSIAQEKLAALAGRTTITTTRSLSPQGPRQPSVSSSENMEALQNRPALVERPNSANQIPFGHPYNLPAPAMPSTPRTTRRRMLSQELSESLRRNMLWERQVSKAPVVRTKSMSTNVGRHANGGFGNGLRPLTTLQQQPAQEKQLDPEAEAKARDEENRKARIARHRSWADDYHYSGW